MSERDIRMYNAFVTSRQMMTDRGFKLSEETKDNKGNIIDQDLITTPDKFFDWREEGGFRVRYIKGNTFCWITFHEVSLKKRDLERLIRGMAGTMLEEKLGGILIMVAPKIGSTVKKLVEKFSPPPQGFPKCKHGVKEGKKCGKKEGILLQAGQDVVRTICLNSQCVAPVMEYFTLTSLQANILNHWLVPKYIHVTEEGFKKNLLKALLREDIVREGNLKPTLFDLLPTQPKRDPVSKWFGARVGDLFLIERIIPEHAVYIRIVVPNYSLKVEKPIKR